MTSLPARFVKTLALFLLALTFATSAWSQERPGVAKEGLFVGGSIMPDFTLDGLTFDGSAVYKKVDGEELVILPRLDRKNMLRGFVGVRTRRGSFEVGYDQTNHVGTF